MDKGLTFGNKAYDVGWDWRINVYNKTTGEIVKHYIIGKYSGQIMGSWNNIEDLGNGSYKITGVNK